MHLVFDIFRGIGAAAAVGIRPFLPGLVVAALAAAKAEIHFKGTKYHFLQQVPFLLVLVGGSILLSVAERRLKERIESRPSVIVLAVISAVVGALLFAGILCQGGDKAWPGFIGGAICALIGALATRPLFARVRRRLDTDAAGALPIYAEALGLLTAALSVVAPPVGVIALLLMLWLIFAGRRREGEKYAGLRILR